MYSRIKSYGIAVLTSGFAWLVDILLEERFNESSGGLYVAAAMISAWYGGFRPALLAVGLTVGINFVFYNHPYLSLAVGGVHGVERLVFFAVVALVMSWMTARIRNHQQLLRNLNFELEDKVWKRTAALQESNQQLEAFCYTLAHDLRAPLRAMQGFADILIMDHGAQLDSESREGLERIRNSAERMGRLIVDLLAYTDLSRAEFYKQPVDLERICRNVLRMFADEISRTHADVTVALPVKEALADGVGVERVLVNLLANALHFADPQRQPRIRISSETKGTIVRISVADNGIGLDPKYTSRIFGVFERLSQEEKSGGTGIGLAIVKRSVEKMGGKVGVESKPGAGSCFWFELEPTAPQKAPEPVLELATH